MLIDKYLPVYNFKEFHAIEVTEPKSDFYDKMLQCDFSKSSIIKLLFWLRGMPGGVFTIEVLSKINFIKLEQDPGSEIVYGIVTDSPMLNNCLTINTAREFNQKTGMKIIKAVINFKIDVKAR